jgi:hypothetical protein
MSQRITIEAHLKEMTLPGPDRRYKVVLSYEQGAQHLIHDNGGKGLPLYQAECLFAVLQKTCVGEYEIHPKVAR